MRSVGRSVRRAVAQIVGVSVAIVTLAACDGHLAGDDDASSSPDATTSDACTQSFACADTSGDAGSPPLSPPVLCPSTPPTVGALCSQPYYEDCEYGASSNYFCDQHFVCVSGQWAANTSYESVCKKDVDCATVIDGGACGSPGESCPMPDAGTVCVCSECGGGPPPPPGLDGSTSNAARWRCFPPGAGCDVDRPLAGTSCDLPDGSACRYTYGSCCFGVDEQCIDNVWVGFENAPCP